jgi:TRAP-type C4-dicarboxylate transport system substrate-binding protein
MKEVVEEASGGAVEMQIFPVGALVGEDSVVDAVSSGAVDGAHIIAGFAANIAPSALGTEMPFGVSNPEEHHALHYEAGLIDIMASEYATSNIELVGIGTSGQLVFMSSVPIKTTEDLSGKKIWTIPNASWLAAFNASPTEVPGVDMYSAMRLGTIDGFTWTLGELEAGNFKEVVKHVMQPTLLVPGTHLIINQDRWNELPDDMRGDIKSALEAAHLKIAAEYGAVDAKAVEAAKEYGVEFTEVDPDSVVKMQEAAASFWDEVEGASPAAAEMVSTYRDFLAR